MPQTFLRRLESHESWVDFRASLSKGDASCPDDIVGELEDADGMSVFEIFDEAADLPRLAAALTMITRVQPFYGVIIPRRAITDCQYVVQRSDGNIFDSKMVKRHWDLTKGPKGNTQQLAERIARCREVNYTGQQIIEYINDEMTNGRLHRNDVFRLTAKLDAGSIMVAHWRSLHLHLRHA